MANWHAVRTASHSADGTVSGSQYTPGDALRRAAMSAVTASPPSRNICVPNASLTRTTATSFSPCRVENSSRIE